MELNEYKLFADKCIRDTPPPCASLCPFTLDVREFARQMQRGSYRSALRTYRDSVIFPGIISRVCPGYCRRACVREKREQDTAVDLKGLEQSLAARTQKQKPSRYAIPKKPQRVAVIGGGLGGLSCAYRMASYGYQVTVFEKTERLGGSICEVLDPEYCREEILKEFSAVDCTFCLGREIRSLDEADADAVYISTGKDGEAFGLLPQSAWGLIPSERDGVFLGGQLTGAAPMEAAAQGLESVTAIETYFKTGKMTVRPSVRHRTADARYYSLHYNYEVKDISRIKGEPEAARCMQCNCSECYDVCPMMEKEKKFPRKMCGDVVVTLKPNMCQRTGVRMITGCTYCGKCRDVCPENIDMGYCMQSARNDFYESGAMSPAFHDFWIRDMEFSLSEDFFLVQRQDEKKPCDVLLFPGCQLAAASPETVLSCYGKICENSRNAAVYLGCCGIPAAWAGMTEEADQAAEKLRAEWKRLGSPLMVTACPSCLSRIRRACPEILLQSVYEWMAEHLTIPVHPEEKSIRILDACSSAGEPEMQKAVRTLLDRAGWKVENEEADPGCCGFGGHIYKSDPELYREFAKRRIPDESALYGVYCANCRDAFVSGHADARHVLDLICGEESSPFILPTLDERRDNRRWLKRRIGHEEEPEREENSRMQILISTELTEQMNRELILQEEVRRVIEEVQSSGIGAYDPEKDIYYGHKTFGYITLWVGYRIEEEQIRAVSVYSHRVTVKEDRPAGQKG